MSASQEKKSRVAQRDAGTDKKRNAVSEAEQKARAFRRNTIIVIAVVVIVVAAALVINSDLFYRNLTAVEVNGTKYSAAEVDVFYRNTFSNIYTTYQNQFGELASYIVDTSTPLSEQQYSETQTWADYVYGETLESMKQITALYDEATASGYTLTQDDQSEIDEQVAMVQLYASMYGASSLDSYLAATYGRGVNEATFRSVMERMIVSQRWADQKNESFTYDQATLDSYYAEHADELDVISYYAYTVSTGSTAFDELEDDDAKQAAAQEAASAIAKAADGEEFAALVDEFSEGASVSVQRVSGANLSSAYSEWLLDSARQPGDATVLDADSGYTALLFVERDTNDYAMRSMRHILINAEEDEDGEYTDEAKAAAETRIREIETEWLTNPTEDNFAALANEYSDDGGSNTSGGLYENIYRHQMVRSIDSFLFDEGSVNGDTTVVYSGDDAGYVGWHLVYYVGEGDTYRDYLSSTRLRNADYSDYIENLVADYTVTERGAVRYANIT